MAESSRSRLISQPTSSSHLGALRQIMTQIPAENRRAMNDFWRLVRQSLDDQDAEIASLRAQLGPRAPVTRPQTSDSVAAIRDLVAQDLDNQAMANWFDEDVEISSTIDSIWSMNPNEAMAYLRPRISHRVPNSLGCWFTDNQPAHLNGYQKLNLRNTRKPTGEVYGVQPFFHQLAIIAGNRGRELLQTSMSSYQVSCGQNQRVHQYSSI
jgi:hypothetical protein